MRTFILSRMSPQRKRLLTKLSFILLLILPFQNCKEFDTQNTGVYSTADFNSESPNEVSPRTPLIEENGETTGTPAMMNSEPQFLKVLKTNGTLKAGKIYLYWRDTSAKIDHLSDFSPGGTINSTPYSDTPGTVLLWGAAYQYQTQNSSCLMRNNDCEVNLLGPLFRQDLPGMQKRFEYYVNSLSSTIRQQISQSTGESSINLKACPTEPSLILRYPAIRNLALSLQNGARVFPFIYNTTTRHQVYQSLNSAAATLRSIGAYALLHSDYNACYSSGGIEAQTLFMTLQALSDWAQTQSNASVNRSFMDAAWAEIKSSNLLAVFKNGVSQDVPVPNSFAQYLYTATALQLAGIDALQSDFTALGIQKLFSAQELSTSSRCLSSALPGTYGGWFHVREIDCAQKVGYHLFIVDSLLLLHSYLKTPAGDSPYWSQAKANIPYNLAAAMAWILNVQDSSTGGIWDQAPGTTEAQITLWGTASGIRTASRIDRMLRQNGFAGHSKIKVDASGSTQDLDSLSALTRKAVLYDIGSKLYPDYFGDYLKSDLQQRLGFEGF